MNLIDELNKLSHYSRYKLSYISNKLDSNLSEVFSLRVRCEITNLKSNQNKVIIINFTQDEDWNRKDEIKENIKDFSDNPLDIYIT